MTICEKAFANIDLNLMVVFLSIYQARSVTLAAKSLNVGQPAVSGSLARLRNQFNDPLFIRAGKGVAPTAKAEQLAAQICPALQRLEAMLTSDLE